MRDLLKFAQELEVQVDDFLKIAQETSTQKGDVYKALFDAKFLGLTGSVNDASWDTSSAAADLIFSVFDRYQFSGSLTLSVSFDPKKVATVIVTTSPSNPKVDTTVKNAFQGKVQASLSKLPPPAETLLVKDIIQARNV